MPIACLGLCSTAEAAALGQGIANSANLFTVLYYVAYLALAVVASAAVYNDANQRSTLVLGLAPFWWALVTFVSGPLIGVALYWILHYSRFGVDQTLRSGREK